MHTHSLDGPWQAAEQIEALRKEIELLCYAVSNPETQPRRPANDGALMRQLRSAAGGLEAQREVVRRRVFRPSHTLPTVSLRQQV